MRFANVDDAILRINEPYNPATGFATRDAFMETDHRAGVTYVQPNAALVFDNSLFGYVGPFYGQRYRLEVAPTLGSWNFTQVTADYATVLLVTDPSSGVAATLARGKAPGIVKGSGAQLLSFQPVRAGTAVRRGDPVVTQAYQDSVFPAGLPIGVVERVDPAGAASLVPRVAVRPYAALGALDVVAIVVERPAPPVRGS